MRLVDPSRIHGFSNETVTSNHLAQVMLAEPEVVPQIATLFERDAPFTSLLAKKGLTSKGLYKGLTSDDYRVVGNRKVMWPVKGIDRRKGRIVAVETDFLDKPGYGGEVLKITIDTNWFSPYDVLELKDQKTLVHVSSDILPQESSAYAGCYEYFVKMMRSSKEEYINPELLTVDSEIGFAYTAFYEMSETAYEKYTFDDWAWSHMTLQRMKWSISGTAAQMKTKKHWVTHNGEFAWLEHAELQMMKRWAQAREYQLVFGKGTVSEKDEVLMRDLKGRDIIAGDGLLNIGDGALKFPYNKRVSKKFLHTIMKNMQILAGPDGKLEVAVIAGQEFMWEFTELMGEMGVLLSGGSDKFIEGEGSSKGINASFGFYEFNNVRFVPVWHQFFDDPSRPQWTTADGSNKGSKRAIFVSLGQVDTGSNNIELLALGNRAMRKGSVYGINKGGDGMQSSVDGEHHHILSETGLKAVNMYGVAEAFVA